jgi:hypothetical protein
VASFRKRNPTFIQLEVDVKHVIEPCDAAYEFSKHFQPVYNHICPAVFPTRSSSSEYLSLAPVSDSDDFKATKLLRPSNLSWLYY